MNTREFTPYVWIFGGLLAVLFGAANAYLGLRVGMTVSASIPAAVVSMAILRGLLRRQNILENNMVQTIASAGESLAAGVIFTLPAFLILGFSLTVWKAFVLSLLGGTLGVLALIPYRRHLIEESPELPYPEGTACAEVLEAGEEGGQRARFVWKGLIAGGIFRFLVAPLGMLVSPVGTWIQGIPTYVALDLSPALGGVGYILGRRIALLLAAGGWLGWGVFLPLYARWHGISLEGPGDAYRVWSEVIRYIGAGAVLAGGVWSFLKSITSLIRARFWETSGSGDLPLPWVLTGFGGLFLLLWMVAGLPWIGVLLALVFGFLFVGVSARITGMVGSSSNPVSGMTIATLLLVSLLFVKLGWTGAPGMVAALTVGAVVCMAAAVAGDTAQDLKTGQRVGATPYRQQLGELYGVLVAALVMGGVVLLLHRAYGIGSRELSAPQATLMALVVKGTFSGSLPWGLLIAGIFTAIVVEMLGVPSLPVAVGLYLPLELSLPILVGSLFHRGENTEGSGILYASGLVAGDALAGLTAAGLVVAGIQGSLPFSFPSWMAVLLWLGVLAWHLRG